MTGRRIHLALTIAWSGLAIPTVVWWRESITWVSLMSVYAIIVSHWSAYQGARAEDAANTDEGSS